MGLDASVKCRCWEDGLCTLPASLAPHLRFDSTTAEVNITPPEGLSEEELLALYLEFDRWVLNDACTHERMSIIGERITNWAGLRTFQCALRGLGERSCDVLLREISNANGGLTTPADARLCLAELDQFRTVGSFGEVIQLVEGGDGKVIHSRIGPYAGWLGTIRATGISHRLTADGTFQIERGHAGVMVHDTDAEVLFRSRLFSQLRMPTGDFCLTDMSSGKKILCQIGLEDESGCYPAMLEVKQSADDPAYYAYCVEPLRRVFQAAIDTGHPVLWS